MAGEQSGQFAIRRTDKNHRTSDRGNPVELAGKDQSLASGQQGHQVNVRHREGLCELTAGLGGMKMDVAEAKRSGPGFKHGALGPRPNEHEGDAGLGVQNLGDLEHWIEIMHPPKVAGVGHDELALQLPCLP